ncbi:MAG TPA: alcohol dehydrogenase catalytic domain-containing protein [Desulfobacteraceae bacterium]|nr:alcohol dehydrogenase catalytic domain-containing protein [Desulfobacteraceae bacterium]
MIKMVLTGLEQLTIQALNPGEQKTGADDVLMEVVCCGVCRTDAKMWEQGHRDLVFPRVLGHEMVVTDGNGNRFAVWPGKSCGDCRYCRSRRENLCREMKITGFHTDGGFAHQVVLPRKSLIPISKAMDPIAACFAEPVGCVINAFEKIPEKSGEKVLVYGGGTMGLITALYAKSMGYHPVVIETHDDKISRVSPFLDAAGIVCTRETGEGEFYIVINACPDVIAFCQAVDKVDKAGHVCFFSGISKNETIDTNLLNLIHYKEAVISGAYGMKKGDMEKAVPFIQNHERSLSLLVEAVLPPEWAPELMPMVLTGKPLKYILDFSKTRGQGQDRYPDRDRDPSSPRLTLPAGAPGRP